MMDKLLKKAKGITQEGCVTITLNTHRTKPDYDKDALNLKNLVKEAEERLYKDFDKRYVWPIVENMQKAVSGIDHSLNIESLVVFANKDFADYTRLPVTVEDRVVIDKKFATRDLIRALYQELPYYVMILNRNTTRMIEAFNDKVVRELGGDFPLDNTYYTTDKVKLTNRQGQDNLIEEYFNQIDKSLWESIKDNLHPVIIATERRNYDYYIRIADRKDLIIGNISVNTENDKPHEIIKNAWKEILALLKMVNELRAAEIEDAIGQKRLVFDYNEVWNAIMEGRGKTLFVKKGYFQPAFVKEDYLILTDNNGKQERHATDDIIDEMIEKIVDMGGEVIFLEGDELDEFNNLALITRYNYQEEKQQVQTEAV